MSRFTRFALLLALVTLLPACEEILPPEPEPAELVLMVTTGRLDILADTVTIDSTQTIRLNRYQLGMRSRNRQDKTQPPVEVDENGIVIAHYYERWPAVFQCVRGGEPTARQKHLWWGIERCDDISTEDDMLLLTAELLPIAKRLMPCAEEINPENIRPQGGFRECATASYGRVERGPGLVSPMGSNPHCTKVGCLQVARGFCGWTWATVVKLDGWREPWPEPFAGQDRVEVEVVCLPGRSG